MTGSQSLLGAPKQTLDTPALLVDLDLMEANIARVAKACRDSGVAWRPHTKGQKTPEIIRKNCRRAQSASLARNWARQKCWRMPV